MDEFSSSHDERFMVIVIQKLMSIATTIQIEDISPSLLSKRLLHLHQEIVSSGLYSPAFSVKLDAKLAEFYDRAMRTQPEFASVLKDMRLLLESSPH